MEIAEGDSIIVGRGTGCDVVLDDDLASRRHFAIALQNDVLTVTDLASRNGVLVNGLPIKGTEELHHGDQVTAGRTPLSVVRQAREPRSTGTSPRLESGVSEDEHTESGNLYQLLEGSARIALRAGDLTTAEGSARSLFVALRGFLARNIELEPGWLVGAVALAIDLADAGQDPLWVRRALELQTTAAVPLREPIAARVAQLAEHLGPDREIIEAYLTMARAHPGDASVAILAPLVE